MRLHKIQKKEKTDYDQVPVAVSMKKKNIFFILFHWLMSHSI